MACRFFRAVKKTEDIPSNDNNTKRAIAGIHTCTEIHIRGLVYL